MKKYLLFAVLGSALLLGACSETVDTSKEDSTQTGMDAAMDYGQNSVGIEARRSETIQKHLTDSQPQPQLDFSLERDNLIQRVERWNDPNKLSYIYLLGENGNVVGYFPMKGKVSSVNSALSAPEQLVDDPNTRWKENSQSQILSSPQEDGSYGENGDAIFFFLTDGTYMEWAGSYLLSDEPIKLNVEPIMTYDVQD